MNKDDLKCPTYCNQGQHGSVLATIAMVLVSIDSGPPVLRPSSAVFEKKLKGKKISDQMKPGNRFIRWCAWCDDCYLDPCQQGKVTNDQREMDV